MEGRDIFLIIIWIGILALCTCYIIHLIVTMRKNNAILNQPIRLTGKVIQKNVDTDGARSIIAEYVYNGQTYQTDISQGYSRNDFLNLSIDAPVNLMISAEHPDYAITEKGADFTKKWTPVIIAAILLFLVCVLFYNFIVE